MCSSDGGHENSSSEKAGHAILVLFDVLGFKKTGIRQTFIVLIVRDNDCAA